MDEMTRLMALLDEAAAELRTMLRALPGSDQSRILRTCLFELEKASYNLERSVAAVGGEPRDPVAGSGASG